MTLDEFREKHSWAKNMDIGAIKNMTLVIMTGLMEISMGMGGEGVKQKGIIVRLLDDCAKLRQ